MSTFSNTPDRQTPPSPASLSPTSAPVEHTAPAVHTPPAIRVPPADDVIIHRFREASPAAIEKLNADFGLSLTRTHFLHLQRLAREHLARDITVAELRLLVALEEADRGHPAREAIGELVTDSDVIAETWADMMDKHTTLHRAQGAAKSLTTTLLPPCTYADALGLPERYLCRTGHASAGGTGLRRREEYAVLTAPWQESVAVAAGYRATAHLLTADANAHDTPATVTVALRRDGTPHEMPTHTGDYLIHLSEADLTAVADLLAADRAQRHPAISAIRAVSNASYIDTILALAPAAEIYTAPLLHETAPAASEAKSAGSPTTETETSAQITPPAPATDTASVGDAPGNAPPPAAFAESAVPVIQKEADASDASPDGAGDIAAPLAQTSAIPAVEDAAPAVAEVPEALTETSEAPAEASGESAVVTENVAKTAPITANATVAQPRKTVAPPQRKIPPYRLSVEKLTQKHYPNATHADFILRVSQKHLLRLTETLRARNIPAVAIAKVTDGDAFRFILHMPDRDVPVALLPAALLREAATVHLHRVTPTMPADAPLPSLSRPLMTRLPGITVNENGIDPRGLETVAPVATAAPVVMTRIGVQGDGMRLSTASVTVTAPGTGFNAAAMAAEAATRPLREIGIAPSAMRLAVSVTVHENLSLDTRDAYTPGSLTAEVLCGLYRVAAENGILPADPTMMADTTADAPSVAVSITAWHVAPALTLGLAKNPRANDPRQAPICLFPVLRRSSEPCLRALATVVNDAALADCRICPVAIRTVCENAVDSMAEAEASVTDTPSEPPIRNADVPTASLLPSTEETSTPSAEASLANAPRKADTEEAPGNAPDANATSAPLPVAHEELIPASASALATRMDTAAAVFLAMSKADAQLLLSDEVTRAALDRAVAAGKRIVVLGEACAAFAAAHLLPETLADLTVVPATGVAEVTYAGANEPSVRLVRGNLLVPIHMDDTPTELTVRLPDGMTVPDGFSSPDGAIHGYLNGLDPTLVSHILTPSSTETAASEMNGY